MQGIRGHQKDGQGSQSRSDSSWSTNGDDTVVRSDLANYATPGFSSVRRRTAVKISSGENPGELQ